MDGLSTTMKNIVPIAVLSTMITYIRMHDYHHRHILTSNSADRNICHVMIKGSVRGIYCTITPSGMYISLRQDDGTPSCLKSRRSESSGEPGDYTVNKTLRHLLENVTLRVVRIPSPPSTYNHLVLAPSDQQGVPKGMTCI